MEIFGKSCEGKKIKKCCFEQEVFRNEILSIEFEDGVKCEFYDDGQSCCEDRYLHSEDDLSGSIGEKFLCIKVKSVDFIDDLDDEEHEVHFISLCTDKDEYSFSCHVEHNGYYGGIDPEFKILDS